MSRLRYDISTGVKNQQIKFKKFVIAGIASLGMVGVAAIPAIAASPTTPNYNTNNANCFGQVRSTNITTGNIPAGPGASGWGQTAADRAGTNAELNHSYMDGSYPGSPCGQV